MIPVFQRISSKFSLEKIGGSEVTLRNVSVKRGTTTMPSKKLTLCPFQLQQKLYARRTVHYEKRMGPTSTDSI